MTKSRGIYRTRKKWSQELLEQILEERFQNWQLTSQFEKASKVVELTCRSCGHKVNVRPYYIDTEFKGHCENCLKLQKGKQMIERLKELGFEPQFEPSEYVNNTHPMNSLCPNGSIYKISFNDLMTSTRTPRPCRCSKCNTPARKRASRTEKQVRRELLEIYGFEVLSDEIKTMDTHVVGRFVECGHLSVNMPKCFYLRKARCRTCYDQERSQKIKEGKTVTKLIV